VPVGHETCDPSGVLHVERPTLEVAHHVVRGHQHGRVRRPADTLAEVAEVVRDPQERAVATERVVGVADRGAALGGDELEVGDQAHVVRRIARPRGGVGADPLDIQPLAQGAALVQPCLGEVDGGDPPAAACEPDRVATLARRQVERASGWQAGQLGLHELVGAGRPHQVARAVPLVPGRSIHGAILARSGR
jgi:hypothetical protein